MTPTMDRTEKIPVTHFRAVSSDLSEQNIDDDNFGTIGSFHMKSTRVIPHEIDLFLDNHSISHTELS